MKYIFPPRTLTSFPKESQKMIQTDPWIAQYKFNDTRCIITYTETETEAALWSRHAERIKNYTPPQGIKDQLNQLHKLLGNNTPLYIDGGILHNKHQAIKNTIIIWDILVNIHHQTGTTYQTRYNQLANITTDQPYYIKGIHVGTHILPNIILPINIPPTDWDTAWEGVYHINKDYTQPLIEGLVYKNTSGILKQGLKPDNNTEWSYKSRVPTKRHKIC